MDQRPCPVRASISLPSEVGPPLRRGRFPVSRGGDGEGREGRSEEHTSELQSRPHLVCRLLLEKKKKKHISQNNSTKNTIHPIIKPQPTQQTLLPHHIQTPRPTSITSSPIRQHTPPPAPPPPPS